MKKENYKPYMIFVRRLGERIIKVVCGFLFFGVIIAMNFAENFSQAVSGDDEIIVVVDAGHGGNDPGKVSSMGVYEKDINLSIAIKLKNELEKMGIKVVLTRNHDTNLATLGATNKKSSDMKNRVELINSTKANCVISIHQNSYTDSGVKGAQVFYFGSSKESKELAELLQANIVSDVDENNTRSAKEGNDYYILRKSVCPGVIIECGFLSCPEETAKLVDEKYQEKLAVVIAKTIAEYYK